MSTKQVVAFDMDGVITDFTLAFTTEAMRLGLVEKPWSCAEQPEWKFDFPVASVWKSIDQTAWWWTNEMRSLITRYETGLINRVISKHAVYFLTNRSAPVGMPSAQAQTSKWLDQIGIDTHLCDVIATPPDTKALFAKQLGVTVAIEDKPDNINQYAGVDIPCYIRTWQYNKDIGESIQHAGSITEFIEKAGLLD